MSKPNKKDKPEYLGDIKVSIVCLAVCGLVIGCRIAPSIINAISSLKSSNTKVVLDISSSNLNNVSETAAVTTVPETTTTTEETTTTLVTTTEVTSTTTTSYKVHILVTGESDKEYTIYDVVSLQTFEDDNIEIIGYNEYRKIGKTKYYRFKTSTGDVITATQDSCYLVVEE